MAERKNFNKKSGVETLAEVFRCFICMGKLQDAHLCPHCSKLCCYGCIRRWLTNERSHCPHCRASLHLYELVNCRWVEEVTQNLDTLRAVDAETTTAVGNGQDSKDDERCGDHLDENLTVFCESCSKCICHRCALWGGTTHAGHSFKPIAEVHELHIQQIKEDIAKLQQHQLKLINFIQKVEQNIDAVRTARDEKANEVCRALDSMLSRIDSQLKSKILTLTARKGLLGQESEKLESIIKAVEHKLSTCSRSELISQSSDLLRIIKAAQMRPLSHLVAAPVLGEFKSEIVPPYDTGTFVIQQFNRLQAQAEAVYSAPLHVNGICWRLKVYPNGTGVVRGLYLSIFLELTAGLPESSRYEYRVEMIHQATRDPRRSIIREFSSEFGVGECWGYNRFFRLDLLSRDGYLDNLSGNLELKFHVRPPTYYQKCRDQAWYIHQLQALEAQYSAQINVLIKRKENEECHSLNVSATSEDLDDSLLPSSPVRSLHQIAVTNQSRENQKSEEPIRESSANNSPVAPPPSSRSTNSDISMLANTSKAERTGVYFSPDESDNDSVSHDPSEDESTDDLNNASIFSSFLIELEGASLNDNIPACDWGLSTVESQMTNARQERKNTPENKTGRKPSFLALLEQTQLSPIRINSTLALAGPNILETLSTSLNEEFDESSPREPPVATQPPLESRTSVTQPVEDSSTRELPLALQQNPENRRMPSSSSRENRALCNHFNLPSFTDQGKQSSSAEQENNHGTINQEDK
ncbi:hypothetical protein J437_LFUL011122 [Ladona fulva]|uniref:E3 ubiquitin-protein ligase TRIM37 n=1 Tax=Ladona fulva TaxID=123851 RepID=A0A8K0KF98_LADFU|nr:hypothetical protein J437_LFUL011122 [Ladona fulva]